ncbi:thiolase family protein [Mycetocola manganoxydans]|uniref:Thiolase family protein n=1 Tax=Mycetocola manganoxydans TaxID=699879 RepID=A0A3L6ZV37_9MICO|nr:thiolase family protein [Mycetocola manganoxydans]RLP71421.1 thiolase family protein [Mycetocola manganoxydans]GHD46409.1 putative acyl-CoA thiolase [Mycetocola manganoxydans]
MSRAVIIDAIRTPSGRGKPGGGLSEIHPVDLLAQVLQQLVERTGIDPARIDDVIAGCVTQAGRQSVNIARNAVLAAGLPESVPGTTVDRQCGSSQQAAQFAAQAIMAGTSDIVIACGVEQMSRQPIGYATLGEDAYGQGVRERYPDGLVHQGISAELIAARWKLSRSDLDAYAAQSHRRAASAIDRGLFVPEVVPVNVPGADGSSTRFGVDETVRRGTTADGLAGLSPAFRTDEYAERFPDIGWNITAGNASPLTDGASAALIMSEEKAEELGLTPLARFVGFAQVGSDPIEMLTGVIPATQRLLERTGVSIDDIDVFEVNEAFASVPLAWQREFDVDASKLNPWGGAIALGHPLGASGTRILATLVNALNTGGGRYGLQTMCEGGGMANATLIERI